MDISIIMPTYNVEKYIRCTLDSIISQTFRNYEVIIIDDESTDNTFEIIKSYSEKYSNIFVERISYSRGPGKARNIGLQKAKGKYICFVDGDDFLPHDALEKMYKFAVEKNADITLGKVFFKNKDFIYVTGKIDMIFKDEINENVKFEDLPPLKYLQGPVAKLFKKSYLNQIKFKFKEEVFYEDFPIVGLAYYLTDKMYLLYEYVYGIRVRDIEKDPSITQTLSDERTKKDLENALKLEKRLMQKHNISLSKKQLELIQFMQKLKDEAKRKGQEYKDINKPIDLTTLPKSIAQFI